MDYLKRAAKGEETQPPEGSILYRVNLAQYLNRLNGCTVFHAWNVDSLPDVDIHDLNMRVKWKEQLSNGS